jgi:hypothetical protein
MNQYIAEIRWNWIGGLVGTIGYFTIHSHSYEDGHPRNQFDDLESAVAQVIADKYVPDVLQRGPILEDMVCTNSRVHDWSPPKVAMVMFGRLVWYPGTDPIIPLCPNCKKGT